LMHASLSPGRYDLTSSNNNVNSYRFIPVNPLLVLQSPIVIRDANLRHDNTAETLKIITHSRGSILFMKCRWRRDGGPMLWFCKYFWPKLVFKIFAILNPSTTTFGYEKWSQDCCSKQRPFCFTKKIGKMPPPPICCH
jgi:hypothetical protein